MTLLRQSSVLRRPMALELGRYRAAVVSLNSRCELGGGAATLTRPESLRIDRMCHLGAQNPETIVVWSMKVRGLTAVGAQPRSVSSRGLHNPSCACRFPTVRPFSVQIPMWTIPFPSNKSLLFVRLKFSPPPQRTTRDSHNVDQSVHSSPPHNNGHSHPPMSLGEQRLLRPNAPQIVPDKGAGSSRLDSFPTHPLSPPPLGCPTHSVFLSPR